MRNGLLTKINFTIFFSTFFAFTCFATSKITGKSLPIDKNVKKFIVEMSTQNHFKKSKLEQAFEHTKYLPKVIENIKAPMEKKSWDFYRTFFVKGKYIKPGIKYHETHEKTLHGVYKKYGVDPNIIVAIIGIESYFGTHVGRYQEMGALATLAFHYPPRSKFFRKELKQYLLLARENDFPVLELNGSYAGALGIPQFMPSSYRHYGVEYKKSQEKKVDLLNNHSDAIASVGNYLKKAGWQRNAPIAVRAIIKGKVPEKIISDNGEPKLTIAQLAKYGVKPAEKIAPSRRAALIALVSPRSKEYWIVFRNFRAIMDYNRSPLYSMAVYLISRKIKQGYEQAQASTRSTKTRKAG